MSTDISPEPVANPPLSQPGCMTHERNTLTRQELQAQSKEPFMHTQAVLVQTAHFKCLAYRDAEGQWWDYFHGNKLDGVADPACLSRD
jgi:hypothetical protein